MGNQIALPIAKENLLGIGFLQISIHKPIPLYLTPESNTPFDTIEFVPHKKKPKKGSYEIRTTLLKERFKPEKAFEGHSDNPHGLLQFAPDLRLRVMEASKHWFRVMVNEETHETAIVRVDPSFKMYQSLHEAGHMPGLLLGRGHPVQNAYLYETWEGYLRRVERIWPLNGKIYDRPEGQPRTPGDKRSLAIKELQGDWLRVEIPEMNKISAEEDQPYEGWVKWREGNEFKISVQEMAWE